MHSVFVCWSWYKLKKLHVHSCLFSFCQANDAIASWKWSILLCQLLAINTREHTFHFRKNKGLAWTSQSSTANPENNTQIRLIHQYWLASQCNHLPPKPWKSPNLKTPELLRKNTLSKLNCISAMQNSAFQPIVKFSVNCPGNNTTTLQSSNSQADTTIIASNLQRRSIITLKIEPCIYRPWIYRLNSEGAG